MRKSMYTNKKGFGLAEAIPLIVFILLAGIAYFFSSFLYGGPSQAIEEDVSQERKAAMSEEMLSVALMSPIGDSSVSEKIIDAYYLKGEEKKKAHALIHRELSSFFSGSDLFGAFGWAISITNGEGILLYSVTDEGLFEGVPPPTLTRQSSIVLSREEYASALLPLLEEKGDSLEIKFFLLRAESSFGAVP